MTIIINPNELDDKKMFVRVNLSDLTVALK